jgi:hypothetical protein
VKVGKSFLLLFLSSRGARLLEALPEPLFEGHLRCGDLRLFFAGALALPAHFLPRTGIAGIARKAS